MTFPQRSSGRPSWIGLLAGLGLVAVGLVALSYTLRFAPWALWRLAWPLLVLAAGVLLLAYGGRRMFWAGLILIGVGLLFALGLLGILLWTALNLLWPLALILPGLAILGNWAHAWRTR
jgi:hypothetical protein